MSTTTSCVTANGGFQFLGLKLFVSEEAQINLSDVSLHLSNVARLVVGFCDLKILKKKFFVMKHFKPLFVPDLACLRQDPSSKGQIFTDI